MIKEALDLVPMLSGYPTPVRALMAVLPVLYLLALVVLKINEPAIPPPLVRIDDVQIAVATANARAFTIIIANPAATTAIVTAAKIELIAGQRPEGGLASVMTVAAHYVVAATIDGLAVSSDKATLTNQVQVIRPYSGNLYSRLTIPLQQQLKPGGSDSFAISLTAPDAILPEHDRMAVSLRYNGDLETKPFEVKLK